MPQDPDDLQKIVTLKSLQIPRGPLESSPTIPQTPEAQLAMARYDQMRRRLEQETASAGSELMVTVQDRETSILQSKLAEQAVPARPLASGGLEVKFGTGFGGGDWFGWLKSLLDHVDRREAHAIMRPTDATAAPVPDNARIALAADWGTGLYGAPKIAAQIIARAPFDVLMHLGDIYYSGTPHEIQKRFLDVWPATAGTINRTLNSNHEMYSGGFGYFDHALPTLNQPSSYFAFQNQHWLLVGLDTAYVDHDMDIEQVAWLNLAIDGVRNANDGKAKRLVLFSHQQPYSRLDSQGPKLQAALRHLLDSRAITAWYWGHEHQCVIYDAHDRWGLLGRCLGNGGIPEPRKDEVKQLPAEQSIGAIEWKRMAATADSPSCLVLDGPNPDIKDDGKKFVPHGFMTLEFNGPTLVERVLLSDGTELLSKTI
jgi:hypothetical protein